MLREKYFKINLLPLMKKIKTLENIASHMRWSLFWIYISTIPCCCLRCNGLSAFKERKYFTVISRISAFSIFEYLETCGKTDGDDALANYPSSKTNIQLSHYTVNSEQLWENLRLFSLLRAPGFLARLGCH